MKTRIVVSALIFLSVLTGCHTFKETAAQYERMPIKVSKSPSKEGRACGSYSFPFSIFYSNIDVSVETARDNGGITEIATVEKEISSSIGYKRICTVVKGH